MSSEEFSETKTSPCLTIFSLTGEAQKLRESMQEVASRADDALPDGPVELPPQEIPLENQGDDSDNENGEEEECKESEDAVVEPEPFFSQAEVRDVE